jgi:hypothetical protein
MNPHVRGNQQPQKENSCGTSAGTVFKLVNDCYLALKSMATLAQALRAVETVQRVSARKGGG